MRTWLITGCSRGLGRAVALEALARGDRVVATARRGTDCADLAAVDPDRVMTQPLDVRDAGSIEAAVAAVTARWGAPDVLVNNAGHGLFGAVEEVSDSEARRLFDVNLFGLLAVTRAVLPEMRAQRSGAIVNISSIAGMIGGAGRGLYSASKFAVEGLSEAMGEELAPLGIHVMAVQPGPFRTDFAGSSAMAAERRIADYAETAGRQIAAQRARDGRQPGDPAKAARVICDALEAASPPRHLILGAQALQRFDTKMSALAAEVAPWRAAGADTDHG